MFLLARSLHNFPEVQVKLKGEEVKAVVESRSVGKGAQTHKPSGRWGWRVCVPSSLISNTPQSFTEESQKHTHTLIHTHKTTNTYISVFTPLHMWLNTQIIKYLKQRHKVYILSLGKETNTSVWIDASFSCVWKAYAETRWVHAD